MGVGGRRGLLRIVVVSCFCFEGGGEDGRERGWMEEGDQAFK